MDAKEAAKIAVEYFKSFASEEITYSRIAVEEIEFDEKSDNWLITVGYVAVPQFEFVLSDSPRNFKVITIRDDDKKVLSMRFHHYE